MEKRSHNAYFMRPELREKKLLYHYCAFRHGMMAAQLAPTALNQQKFFVTLEGDSVTVTSTKKNAMAEIDRGIVRCQFEAASGHPCR